jgi:hypothetical protein
MKLVLRYKKGLLLSIHLVLLQFIGLQSIGQTFTGTGGPILDADKSIFSQQVYALPTYKLRPQ